MCRAWLQLCFSSYSCSLTHFEVCLPFFEKKRKQFWWLQPGVDRSVDLFVGPHRRHHQHQLHTASVTLAVCLLAAATLPSLHRYLFESLSPFSSFVSELNSQKSILHAFRSLCFHSLSLFLYQVQIVYTTDTLERFAKRCVRWDRSLCVSLIFQSLLCDVRLINNSVLTVFTARYVSSFGGQTWRQSAEPNEGLSREVSPAGDSSSFRHMHRTSILERVCNAMLFFLQHAQTQT